MGEDTSDIRMRAMTEADIGAMPIGCQGDEETVRARIRDIGSSAILAFDGDRHVGQLQFRRYAADTRSPTGMWEPLYWGDFGAHGDEDQEAEADGERDREPHPAPARD